MAAIRVLGLPNLQVNILAWDSFLDADRGQKSPRSETNYKYLPKKKKKKAVVSNTEVIGKEKEGGSLKGM